MLLSRRGGLQAMSRVGPLGVRAPLVGGAESGRSREIALDGTQAQEIASELFCDEGAPTVASAVLASSRTAVPLSGTRLATKPVSQGDVAGGGAMLPFPPHGSASRDLDSGASARVSNRACPHC